jgi:mannose-1-phosphate guanylyltransferase / mannose-6-phosphate isomerase
MQSEVCKAVSEVCKAVGKVEKSSLLRCADYRTLIYMKAKIYIMAGGGGTRLRPLSQTEKGKLPKQFLTLVGKHTLLQEAIARIPDEYEIGVIPEKRYSEEVYRQAGAIGREVSVLEEPFGCNTAAAIIFASLFEEQSLNNKDRILCFMPADHKMDSVLFQDLLEQAVDIAGKYDKVVTIGIQPEKPETNYGYIQTAKPFQRSLAAFEVERFVEKPDRETAEMYLRDGGYYWNAGIFIVRSSVLLKEAERHCPDILKPIADALYLNKIRTIADAYRDIKDSGWNISIDYALMEHIADRIVLLPAQTALEWNDLGNWESLYRYMEADQKGNALFADMQDEIIDSSQVMVCNYTDIPVRIENSSNLLVVVTENGILIREKQPG